MRAPQFTLPILNSDAQVSLHSFIGKPVMLTFWASWCPDSQRDLHMKEQLFQSMTKNKFIFLTINVSGREANREAPKKYIEGHGFTFPVLIDEETKTYDSYQCMGVPTTVLLSKHHEIVAIHHDKASFTDILQDVGKII